KDERHAELHFELAVQLTALGKLDGARTHVERALTLDSKLPRAHELRGHLRQLAGDLTGASQAFAESLRLRPNASVVWRRHARVLVELGEHDRAIAAFRAAIACNPDELEPYRRLAALHLQRGDAAAALRVQRHGASRHFALRLELVAQLCSTDPRTRDLPAAVRTAEVGVQREPENPRAHLLLAFAGTVAGRGGDHAQTLRDARRLGADPACCTGLAIVAAVQRRDADAVKRQLAAMERELRTPSREPLRGVVQRLVAAATQGQ
ncbi:MAG: tetratricopeptide repeat protein, partial [Planctomycetes bacterium]|nr:tetratricopeptide repeat protein [Planctomycetota bacterium]